MGTLRRMMTLVLQRFFRDPYEERVHEWPDRAPTGIKFRRRSTRGIRGAFGRSNYRREHNIPSWRKT